MSEVTYHCSVCGKNVNVREGDAVPLCCHQEMAPLEGCTLAQTAEHARLENPDEPCDEGTGRPKTD